MDMAFQDLSTARRGLYYDQSFNLLKEERNNKAEKFRARS
jgi:hypothetical protein